MNICVFAGTIEGRTLSEALVKHCNLSVCVATEYGRRMDRVEGAYLHAGRMDSEEMREFFLAHEISLVIDATHPYAVEASRNISMACTECGVEYLRLERTISEREEGLQKCIFVEDARSAAEYLKDKEGNVLLTTGVKELDAFAQLDRERLYARIIPAVESLTRCLTFLEPGHIIAALGPFSTETNLANLHSTKAAYLVTKQSGKKGGFEEKLAAAELAGVECVIIGKPENVMENSFSEEELRLVLSERLGVDLNLEEPTSEKKEGLEICILGCGSGEPEQMTMGAMQSIQNADVLIGSERLLKALGKYNLRAEKYCAISAEKIVKKLEEYAKVLKPDAEIAVLMSGDSGFYSGTKRLLEVLAAEMFEKQVTVLPGLSCISMLAAKVQESWEDAVLCSLHGREGDYVSLVQKHRKVFFLLDQERSLSVVASRLTEAGCGEVLMYAGSSLGTKDEILRKGYAWELVNAENLPLTVLLVINENGLGENAFGN